MSTTVHTISSIERLALSRNGNPRFRMTFADGRVAETQSDASYGYAVGNPGHRPGDTIEVTWSRAGKIAFAKSVPEMAATS